MVGVYARRELSNSPGYRRTVTISYDNLKESTFGPVKGDPGPPGPLENVLGTNALSWSKLCHTNAERYPLLYLT
jgi:hypothetical protein